MLVVLLHENKTTNAGAQKSCLLLNILKLNNVEIAAVQTTGRV